MSKVAVIAMTILDAATTWSTTSAATVFPQSVFTLRSGRLSARELSGRELEMFDKLSEGSTDRQNAEPEEVASLALFLWAQTKQGLLRLDCPIDGGLLQARA